MLTGAVPLSQALAKDSRSGAYALAMTRRPPKLSTMFTSAAMARLLEVLKEGADLVVMDCSRAVAPEAGMLAQLGDATLLVTRKELSGQDGAVAIGAMALRQAPRRWRLSHTKSDLARQFRTSHQELVHAAGALAAFADRPDHQRLAAAHVAAGEDLGRAGLVVGQSAALTLPRASSATPGLLHQARLARADEAHRQQHQIGLEGEFAARHFDQLHLAAIAQLPVHPHAFQRR